MPATKTEIMKPGNARWEEFTERLSGPEACDFKLKDPDDPMSFTWTCKGGTDKSMATAILEDMGGFDVVGSLVYFERNGGYCDCEILFNVDR